MSERGDLSGPVGPYETERQARADVADVYEQYRYSAVHGALTEVNLSLLVDACERTDVALGAFDKRILSWLANWELETCGLLHHDQDRPKSPCAGMILYQVVHELQIVLTLILGACPYAASL